MTPFRGLPTPAWVWKAGESESLLEVSQTEIGTGSDLGGSASPLLRRLINDSHGNEPKSDTEKELRTI